MTLGSSLSTCGGFTPLSGGSLHLAPVGIVRPFSAAISAGAADPSSCQEGYFFVLERLLQQVPEQFSRDYYDTKK